MLRGAERVVQSGIVGKAFQTGSLKVGGTGVSVVSVKAIIFWDCVLFLSRF